MTRTEFAYHAALSDVSTGHHPRLSPLALVLRRVLPSGVVGGESHGRWMTFNRFAVHGVAYGGLIGSVEAAARFLAMDTADGTRNLCARGGLDVGLGWFRRRDARSVTEPHVEHLGGGAGFWNVMRLYPRHRAGVVVMGNATTFEHEEIARATGGI